MKLISPVAPRNFGDD